MKKIFFLPIFLLFFACSKDKQANSSAVVAPDDFLSYIKSKITEDPDINISSTSISYPNKPNIEPQVTIATSVNYITNKNFIKEVFFGEHLLSKMTDTTNKRTYFEKNLKDNTLFGQKVGINVKTDSFDFKTDFQLPKVAQLDIHSEDISKSKGYTFYWNKDINNDLPVQISLQYSEFASRFTNRNAVFPKEVIQITKFVQDSGEYTFSPSELSKFPLGAIATLTITRGTFSYQKSNHKNILISSISINTIPVLTILD